MAKFSTLVASGGVGILAEATTGTGLAVRVGTEERLPGSYTLLISGNGTCDPSSSSLCLMQPGLVSSSQQTMLAGKMVYELLDPSNPSSQALSVKEMPADNLPLLDGSTQLLLNTTDGQPQDAAALSAEPFTSLHTVAGNVYNASRQQNSELSKRLIPTKISVQRSRKTREPRPNRAGRNITLNIGNEKKDENHSEMLQTTPLIWFFASLVVFVVV
ncbi:hypothetical protein GMOD_00001202 [Pyrenophora seminiperda CCB06]|uniref:Uncharacterized protein n=1 Tax=Pyrenophora seminiperda CCB06 TaxID=1302712 RepID=A0A3M7LYL8_9PLEO|nr:hypothetical protein GMOD_00001202 [Pyrenophora seminiperda CCB06]